MLHLQHFAQDLLQSLRDRIAVQWAQRNDLENQRVKRALEEVRTARRHRDT